MARRAATKSNAPTIKRMAEIPYMQHLMLALGSHPTIRIHRQNPGEVPVRDRTGEVVRVFHGAPTGSADISGIVGPEGYRLEIETKASDGTQSDAQKKWQAMIELLGGVYVLAGYDDSQTLEQNLARTLKLIEDAIARRRAA